MADAVQDDPANKGKKVVEFTMDYPGFLRAKTVLDKYILSRVRTKEVMDELFLLGSPGLNHVDFFALKESMDDYNRVPLHLIYELQFTKMTLFQTRLELRTYETEPGSGYITESTLEQYILSLATVGGIQMPDTVDQETFPRYYACSVTRRIMWVLDPGRRRRISLEKFMDSAMLRELIMLPFMEDGDGPLSPARQALNFDHFCYLANGEDALKQDHMGRYGGLTGLFIERIFEVMGVEEMDFRCFIDFLLTIENINSDQVVPFLFKVLDLHGTGSLKPMTIHRFLTTANPHISPPEAVESIITELYDMISPRIPMTITQADLLRAGAKRQPFLGILLTHSGFQMYEEQQSGDAQQRGPYPEGPPRPVVRPLSIPL
eukprot:TRINITY_DN37968_c0_g1_i1.p1 TRINITY_DN37968_c0_g1~~TRINITY_DN37968_c0_g1_i1.p1  ORF type:complete len:426 (+),score=70.29 TRINITY_DN37968_c0_g1_i1:151-1278(+)